MTAHCVSSLDVENWRENRLPDLSGKVFVITGGNSGIGFEAARMLGEAGADLILACRSPKHAKAAKTNLERTIESDIALVHLDLVDQSTIRACASTIRSMTDRIDGLINNAGIMRTPQTITADGFELQFATNHLGHFLLTSLLLDLVEAAAGRVVTVASIAHNRGQIAFDNLMLTSGYSPSKAYNQSKLANLLFSFELDRRLQLAHSPAIAIACHPGYAATNAQSTGPTGFWKLAYKPLNAILAQSQSLGAVSLVLAAAGAEAKRGAYYGPTGFLQMRGPVTDAPVAAHALAKDDWKRLWEASEELLGITFRVGA